MSCVITHRAVCTVCDHRQSNQNMIYQSANWGTILFWVRANFEKKRFWKKICNSRFIGLFHNFICLLFRCIHEYLFHVLLFLSFVAAYYYFQIFDFCKLPKCLPEQGKALSKLQAELNKLYFSIEYTSVWRLWLGCAAHVHATKCSLKTRLNNFKRLLGSTITNKNCFLIHVFYWHFLLTTSRLFQIVQRFLLSEPWAAFLPIKDVLKQWWAV